MYGSGPARLSPCGRPPCPQPAPWDLAPQGKSEAAAGHASLHGAGAEWGPHSGASLASVVTVFLCSFHLHRLHAAIWPSSATPGRPWAEALRCLSPFQAWPQAPDTGALPLGAPRCQHEPSRLCPGARGPRIPPALPGQPLSPVGPAPACSGSHTHRAEHGRVHPLNPQCREHRTGRT